MAHYLRVQEAASLLGVAPTTIRWYCAQDWLPTYWVGRGQVGHRRFLYGDVEALGKRLGRIIPPEKDWSIQDEWDISDLSKYLGLSAKFLISTGLVQTGMKLSWDQVQEMEQTIYGSDNSNEDEKGEQKMHVDGSAMDEDGHSTGEHHHSGRRHRGGSGFSHHGQRGFSPNRDPKWNHQFGFGADRKMAFGFSSAQDWLDNMDVSNLLTLKQSLRHLETQKLDLEDVITELKKKIETHPDCEEN